MPAYISVQVPKSDRSELLTLAERLGSTELDASMTRPFDGEAMLQTLIPATLASIPILRVWIKSRTERAKNYRISCSGVEINGYSAEEACAILEKLLPEPEDGGLN